MTVSAFIRSYRRDFQWLSYLLRSLEIRGQCFEEIVVAVPQADMDLLNYELSKIKTRANVIGVEAHAVNGYIDQQITKCHADQYCSGDFIMHIDSDCVAEREIKLSEFFFHESKHPKMLIRKWEDAGDAKCWKPITRSVLGIEPMFETMASMPLIYHRSSHELFRRHVEQVHQRDFITYVSRLAQFSEFNALGNFCHLYTPDAYSFIRATGPGDGYPRPLRQFWSHGKLKCEEMEALL